MFQKEGRDFFSSCLVQTLHGMMVFGVIRCYVLGGKLELEEGKQGVVPEGWDLTATA